MWIPFNALVVTFESCFLKSTSIYQQKHLGWDCAISFLLYSIVKSQSLTPVIFMTKEYSDMSLCKGGKIRL